MPVRTRGRLCGTTSETQLATNPTVKPLDHWYGFVVAAIVFLCQFSIYGSLACYSVFADEITQDPSLGKPSATAVALGASIGMGVSAIVGIIAGGILDRYGPRVVLCSACVLTSAGWLLPGLASDTITFVLLFSAPQALGSAFLVAGGPAVSGWLDKRLSLGFAIAYSGGGAGSCILVPFAGWLSTYFGWQACFRILAIVPGMGLVASLFLVPRVKPQPRPPMSALDRRFAAALLRSRSFRVLWLTGALYSFAYFATIYVMVPFAAGYGKAGSVYAKYDIIDLATASTLFTCFGAFMWLGSVTFGGAAHHSEARFVFCTVCGFLGVTCCLWPLSTTYYELAIGAAAAGFGYGGVLVVYPAMAATCFAGKFVGIGMGATSSSLGVGGLLGPPVVIAVNAASEGSWTGAFGLMGLFVVASGALCLIGGSDNALRHQPFAVDPPGDDLDPFAAAGEVNAVDDV